MLSRKDTDFLYKNFGICFSDMKSINIKKTTNKDSFKKNHKVDAMF